MGRRDCLSHLPWDSFALTYGERLKQGWVVRQFLGRGGCGAVYRAVRPGDPRSVAVKILALDKDDENYAFGVTQIEKEALLLRQMQGCGAPAFVAQGTVRGLPYVMMESLVPLAYEEGGMPSSPEDIRQFALDILTALERLHAAGWVHCDLKPNNIVQRPSDGRYLLIDFGGAHELEMDVVHEPRPDSQNLQNGVYKMVGTRGYMPPDQGYLPARDIYAFGHLLRDCFPMEVPLAWNLIIGKCISNNPDWRYPSVAALKSDVLRLDELGREEMEQNIRRWRTQRVQEQKVLVTRRPMQMTTLALQRKLASLRGAHAAFYVGEAECLVDLAALGQASLELTTPFFLRQEKLLVIKGPGVLRCDLSCDPSESHTVVLMDGATLINTSSLPPQVSRLTYCVGEHCYVNLKRLAPGQPLPDGTSWTSSSGNAFVRRGGPDCVADILSDVDISLWKDRRPNEDESLRAGAYAGRPGLTSYLCEHGQFFAAMGVEQRGLRARLDEAFLSTQWCPERKRAGHLPCLGAILGNVCVSRFAHANRKSKDFELLTPACRMLADGNMTLAVAAALEASARDRRLLKDYVTRSLQIFGRFCHEEFGERFQEWIFSRNPQPTGSWGNGAAMRVSPCAWVARSLDEALELARVVTAVTHDAPEGLIGAEAVTAAIFLARQKKAIPEIKAHIVAKYYPQLTFTLDEIRPHYKRDTSCPGSVPQALEAFFESTSFEDALRNAASLGGDADTLAAIACSVAEAYYGIPRELESRFLKGRFIDKERLAILRGLKIGRMA